MTLKEYLHLVFRPRQTLWKYKAYITLLEKAFGIKPITFSEFVDKVSLNGNTLMVLGDNVQIANCGFDYVDVVVHPDARNVLIYGCHFQKDAEA